MFDKEEMVCKLHKEAVSTRVCDLIHGTAQPNLQTCVDEGVLQWTQEGANHILTKTLLAISLFEFSGLSVFLYFLNSLSSIHMKL